MAVGSTLTGETMSMLVASSKAWSFRMSLFFIPGLRLSKTSAFLSDEIPIRLAFMRLLPCLLSEVTKSLSLPPFQLNSTLLSPTTKVYFPGAILKPLSMLPLKKRSAAAGRNTSSLKVPYSAFLSASTVTAFSSDDVACLLLNGFSKE